MHQCLYLNGFDLLMLKDMYLIFLKQSRISHIRVMLQLLFAEFLTTHICLDTIRCRKLLILLPQNQVVFPSELSIVFLTLRILRKLPWEWVSSLYSWIFPLVFQCLSTFPIPITDGTKACILRITEPYLSNLSIYQIVNIYFTSNNESILMLMH